MKINGNGFWAVVLGVVMLFGSCSGSVEIEGLPEMNRETEVKFKQYYRDGRILYVNYCASCHMENGEGLKNAIPSLQNSPLFRRKIEKVPCQIKFGAQKHNTAELGPGMLGFYSLSPLEIAEITTYISSSWGNKNGLMTVKETKTILDNCENQLESN